MTVVEGSLAHLASMYGIALEYWDQTGGYHAVSRETVVGVLAAMRVDAGDDESIRAAITAQELRSWRRALPPVFVHRQSRQGRIWGHVRHGVPATATILTEGGGAVQVDPVEHLVAPREMDGVLVGEAMFAVPPGLPLGWHEFRLSSPGAVHQCPLVVTPDSLPPPTPGWGLMAQLYSLRSATSWGIGDVGDLADLARGGADLGADFVLVNPMHAAAVVPPMEPSPYLPATRRFFNPIYLSVPRLREYRELPPETRRRVDRLGAAVVPFNRAPDLLDRDAAWAAKQAALELLWQEPMPPDRLEAFEAFLAREGAGLTDFARWSALCERHGANWREWPSSLRDPNGAAVAHAAPPDRVRFHAWLQWLMDRELAGAQGQAAASGMRIGIVHDLAVGVHGNGADAWRLGDVLAPAATVGAPPDVYNQLGQDWSQPPWLPDALAEEAFLPYRDMLRTVLRHAGGLRVDHILGLYRQWWIPEGMAPHEGAYVSVDHEAMVGILLLEASRTGAVVIGEDLGTVEDWIRTDMHERGILGTGVLWFERDAGHVRPPEVWRSAAMASVTVHDLPPTAGYLEGAHLRLRHDLGLLNRELEEEQRDHDREMGEWLEILESRELLPRGGRREPADVLVGLYGLLAGSGAVLRGVNVPDLVSDVRPQNQPGTHREYPNWCLPVCDADGNPVLLEDLFATPVARRVVESMRATRS